MSMSMQRISSYSLVLSLGCMTLFSHEKESSSFCQNGKRHYRLAARHIEAGGIGYTEGYTTLEGFFASDPESVSWMPFLDVRGHVFNSGKIAANAGIGFRGIIGCRTYGCNAYYDYRNTKKLHYNQVGVGLETLGTLWDLRINGYLPVGKKITAPYNVKFGRFSGHQLLLSQKRQFAMKGADAEIGFHFGKSLNFDFYAAAGPYYFIGEIGPNTWGGKARLAAMYKDYITVEIRDSYDSLFHNNFQGQLTCILPLGSRSSGKKTNSCISCRLADAIGREEIIVVGKRKQDLAAIDPATGLPYFFVFVDNTSSSNGTYEDPYPSLVQAQNNSSPNDIIYVFPGNGTTTGMASGIFLQANQKFWGSGISHSLQTSKGPISIPAQSTFSPTITNTNIDTDGNAITLATNNAISGFIITSTLNDAIFGTDPQSLQVSSCLFKNISTYAIEASFSGDASLSVTNNQFLNNVNGIFLTLNGTSTLTCSDNMFQGQTSISSIPLEVSANSNAFVAHIERNVFNDNTTGSIRFDLNNTLDAAINVINNTLTNNATGSQSILGSNFVIIPTGTIAHCSLVLDGNTFSGNTSHSLYLYTSGAFTTLDLTASTNTMSDNGGSGLTLATPVDTLMLFVTNNTITGPNDNGIAVIASSATSTANITINNNTITDVGNASNGIAINQDFTALDLTILDNEINTCQGSGILSFPPTGISSLTLNISDNTISNCQNLLSGNAASGISLDNYLNLTATVANNTLSNDLSPCVALGFFTPGNPTACLTLTGNNSDTDPSYSLTNPGSGAFNLSPCNVDSVNVGMIDTTGTITPVQSCSSLTPCP